jgi:energy-coupling factor transport system substrate-specific component
MNHAARWRPWLSGTIYVLTSLIGLGAFLMPFLLPKLMESETAASPLLTTILVAACFVALLLEVQGDEINTKFIALLGVLVAINAVLRFMEVAIPGPGGFSPIFFLIVLTGYAYGARFGFLMGALTLLVSALVTGTMGPWLPYQMFTAGWCGLSAAVLRPVVRYLQGDETRLEIILLTLVSGLWGLLYGAIMNISFWPYATGAADQYWEAGITLAATLKRYLAFYAATSLLWDSARAMGNLAMMLAFGAPTLRTLRRFRRRFEFTYQPVEDGLV